MLDLNLIKGGIYSIPRIPDVYYYVYLGNYGLDKLMCLRVKTKHNNLENILKEIDDLIYLEDGIYLRRNVLCIDKESFFNKYDGYLGRVSDKILKEIHENY